MTDKLRAWCRENWNRIDPLIRKDCVDHLDGWISKEILQGWIKDDYDRLPGFHFFGGGMQIRNKLREQLLDEELPVVTIDHEGKPYGPSQNWDDYYTGALDELLERYR